MIPFPKCLQIYYRNYIADFYNLELQDLGTMDQSWHKKFSIAKTCTGMLLSTSKCTLVPSTKYGED